MAGLFDFLYGEGQALAFIKQGIKESLGFPVILESLEKGGIFIREELAQKVFTHLTEAKRVDETYVKYLQQFATPDITRLPLAVTEQTRNFNYRIQYQGLNAFGEFVNDEMVINSNVLLTKQQAEDMAADKIESMAEKYKVTSAAVKVVGITQRAGGLFPPL
jgi:hypothetical protein